MSALPVWQKVCILLGVKQQERSLEVISTRQWEELLDDCNSGRVPMEEIDADITQIIDFIAKRIKRGKASPMMGAQSYMLYF